jgi:hypothetical protein
MLVILYNKLNSLFYLASKIILLTAEKTLLYLAVCLLASHVIGEYLIKVESSGDRKRQALILPVNAIIAAGWSYVLCGAWKLWEIPLLVLVSHVIIDFVKSLLSEESVVGFFVYQIIYFAIAVLITAIIGSFQKTINLFWINHFGFTYLKILIFSAGATATIFAGNILISRVVKPFIPQIEREACKDKDSTTQGVGGLTGGGQLIGQMERTLIFLFIMTSQPTAIGFLITAKSILRFGEIKDYHQRMLAEYIIIGTMASFAYGIAVSYLTKFLMGMF